VAATRGDAVARGPRITLIGKPGCHLCEAARDVVERVAAHAGVGWREVSILDDEELAERYWEHIPVVLVDGEQLGFLRIDEARLRDAVTGRRRWFDRVRSDGPRVGAERTHPHPP
jgi:glutaredoxin